jgi:hypothetical protein
MSDLSPRKTPLAFYRHASGGEPVREWLEDLGEIDRQTIGRDLMRAQWRWPVGMPLCRPLGQGLWEIRIHPSTQRSDRAGFRMPGRGCAGCPAWIYQEDAKDAGQ